MIGVLVALGCFALFVVLLVAGCCALAVHDSDLIDMHPPDMEQKDEKEAGV